MKNYFKKFSVMLVMALAVIGFGIISNGTIANAAEDNYVPKKDYSQNLVANYKFDETTGTTCKDSTGKYNGTYNGTTTITDSNGTYRTFNGTSDYISFSNVVIPMGGKTIHFKIKIPTNNTSSIQAIFNNSETTAKYGLQIYYYNKSICVASTYGNVTVNNFFIQGTKVINDNQWHDILFTWDGTTSSNAAKLYIDDLTNANVTGTALTTETVAPTYNLVIGAQANVFNLKLNGSLDEIEIYNDVIEYENKSITLDKSSMNLNVGDSQQLTATTPAGAQVTWTSSDPSIAAVDSTGKVTGVKEGQATITTTTADGLTATCVVTVTKENKSISLNKKSTNLAIDDSETLIETTTPAGISVKWSSSDPSVATVDSNGKVTAIGAGTATITATALDGSNLSASCLVTVTPKGNGPTPAGSEYITNIAHAKGTNTNNPGGEVTIIFHGTADTILSLVKTADVKDVWIGDNFTYTLVITNTGTKTAKAVVANDPAPNHIDFNVSGVTTTQGTVDSSSTSKNIIVNVGDIPPAGIVTIKIPASVIA